MENFKVRDVVEPTCNKWIKEKILNIIELNKIKFKEIKQFKTKLKYK